MTQRLLTATVGMVMMATTGIAQPQRLDYLTTDGIAFVDESGDPVILRGCNVGNWLLLEMWMQASWDGSIPDQHTLETILTDRFGAAEKNRLMEVWRSSFITEEDFRLIRSFDFNVVRLPFWHTILEEDLNPFVLKEDAFVWLDQAIEWAERQGLYIILDLHGAPGSQGWEHHTGQEGRNELWSSQENQDRTVWLWRQIAERYRHRTSIAAFDLLNEPWGSTDPQLRDLIYRIAAEVRDVDPFRVVLLPGHYSGIGLYGNPRDEGLENAAFTHHFYPGLFGGGDPTVATHASHFQNTGSSYSQQLRALDAPFLVGEMNVVHESAGGGEMMRHHFDYYAAQGWATTAWSWKVFTGGGGAGKDSWGMSTNSRTAPYVSGTTWICDNWDSSFEDACGDSITDFVAPGEGPVSLYYVIKAGSCCGFVNMTVDDVSLRPFGSDEELLAGGDFESLSDWQTFSISGALDIAATGSPVAPTGSSGRVLRLSGNSGDNGGVYQRVVLQGGQRYQLSGRFRDAGSAPDSAWCEIYLDWREPVPGRDYPPGLQFGGVDFRNASKAGIEELFASSAAMPVQITPQYREWLAGDRVPTLITPWEPVLRVPRHTEVLPFPWHGTDIGGARRGGQRVPSHDGIELYAAGEDIWGTRDSFRFVATRTGADAVLTARVRSLTDTDTFAKAGLMVRTSLRADSPSLLLGVRPNGIIELNSRLAPGAGTNSTDPGTANFPDAWLRLSLRAGTGDVTAHTSDDGIIWSEAGSLRLPASPEGSYHIGLAGTSHEPAQFARAEFNDISFAGNPEEPTLEEEEGWNHWFAEGPVRAYRAAPDDDQADMVGTGLRLIAPPQARGGVYRSLHLVPRVAYRLSGKVFASAPESGSTRLRILLAEAPPVDGAFPSGEVLIDLPFTAGTAWEDTLAEGVDFEIDGTGGAERFLVIEVRAGADVTLDELRITPGNAGTTWFVH